MKKRSMLSRLWRKLKTFLSTNEFEEKLAKAKGIEEVYIAWNRGMGDVPLGLYGVVVRIHHFFPAAKITFFTRRELADVFAMLPGCEYQIVERVSRGDHIQLPEKKNTLSFPKIDPTKELPWLPGLVVPSLVLPQFAKQAACRFKLGKECIGIHIDSETGKLYGYEKNWPKEHWNKLLILLLKQGMTPLLFGKHKTDEYQYEGVIDLRGDTTLFDVCAIALYHCNAVILPDSGILSTLYYVDEQEPLHIISLWADPEQGVLRQGVPSPNGKLTHTPLVAPNGDLRMIKPEDVYEKVCQYALT